MDLPNLLVSGSLAFIGMPGIFELLILGFVCLVPLIALTVILVVVLLNAKKRPDGDR